MKKKKHFNMRTLFPTLLFMSITMSLYSQKRANSYCVSYYTKQEASCQNGGITVYYTNTCSETLDIFIAVERNNGDWSKGVNPAVKSGGKGDFIVCNASKNIVILTRKANENSNFPTLKDLKEYYSGR